MPSCALLPANGKLSRESYPGLSATKPRTYCGEDDAAFTCRSARPDDGRGLPGSCADLPAWVRPGTSLQVGARYAAHPAEGCELRCVPAAACADSPKEGPRRACARGGRKLLLDPRGERHRRQE